MHQTTSKNRDGAQLFINNWAPSLFFLISILVHLRLSDYAFDDAYIHFRISQNFVSHGYPYYNLGDATMVTSSPIWTMLLSTIFFIFGNNLCSVAILNGVILVLAALTWGNLISEKVSFLKTIIIAALLSVSSFGLMETPLALLFLGIGTFLDKRNDSRAFIFLTLAFFTRFELGIFLILFLIKHWQGRRFSKAAIYTFVTSLPIITFCFHYFATLTPNTISAKSIVYNLTSKEFIQVLFTNLNGENLSKNLHWIAPSLVIVTICCLILFFISNKNLNVKIKKDSNSNLLLFGAAFILVLFFIKKVLIFPWYIPCFSVPLAFALMDYAKIYKAKSLYILLLAFVIFPIFTFSRDVISAFSESSTYSNFSQGKRVQLYREIGKEIYQSNPKAKVLAPEIGGLGFEFKGEIIDALGLASPNSLTFHPLKVPQERESGLIGAVPIKLVENVQPDYIVSLEIFVKELLKSEVISNYDITYRELDSAKLWKSSSVVIFKKIGTEPN